MLHKEIQKTHNFNCLFGALRLFDWLLISQQKKLLQFWFSQQGKWILTSSNNKGHQPLYFAVQLFTDEPTDEYLEVIQLLLAENANPDLPCEQPAAACSPFDLLVSHLYDAEIDFPTNLGEISNYLYLNFYYAVDMLVTYGANWNLQKDEHIYVKEQLERYLNYRETLIESERNNDFQL